MQRLFDMLQKLIIVHVYQILRNPTLKFTFQDSEIEAKKLKAENGKHEENGEEEEDAEEEEDIGEEEEDLDGEGEDDLDEEDGGEGNLI